MIDPFAPPRKKAEPVVCRWCRRPFTPRTFQRRPQFCKKLCEVRFKARRKEKPE